MHDSQCPWGYSRETLSAWRDEALPSQRGQALQAHLPACPLCQIRLQEMAALGQFLRQQREIVPGPTLWQGVYQRIQRQFRGGFGMRPRAIWGGVIGLLIFAVLTVFLATMLQARQQSGSGGPPPTATTSIALTPTSLPSSTPTATALTATPTPSPTPQATTVIQGCASFTGSVPASYFLDQVVLPAGTKFGSQQTGVSDGVAYSFTNDKLTFCSPALSASGLRAFFASSMVQNGWQPTTTFPDGYAGKCADQYCWQRSTGAKTARFIGLLNVVQSVDGTSYVIDSLEVTYN